MSPYQYPSGNTLIWVTLIGALAPCVLIAVKWYFNSVEESRQRGLMEAQGQDIQQVKAELSPNGKKSVKDKVDQGADDSKKTLDLVAKMATDIEDVRAVAGSVEELKADVKSIKEDCGQMHVEIGALEKKVNRLIAHDGRNDLGRSDLLKEVEEALKNEPKVEPEENGESI